MASKKDDGGAFGFFLLVIAIIVAITMSGPIAALLGFTRH